jgi:tetratricopeptide (TPR) repeat protein
VQNANPAVRKATQQSHDGASVVRFDAIPGLQIRPRQDGGQWHLSLAAQSALPSRPLRVEVRDGRVVIPVEAAGPVVDMADPGAGGRLFVVPLAGAGQGMSLRRDFPEFTLLPTVVGVAVVPKAEHVAVSTGEEGVVIHGCARILAVSNPGHGGGADATADALNGRRLLDLPAWRRADEPYSKARRRLQKAVVDAPPAKKHLARLELARFYFAHGLAAETLGALEVYTEKTPRRAEDPQVRLMAGAAHALQGEWREAGEALTHPSLDGALDALPWRAAHAAATGADEAAVNAFHRSENVLGAYPDSVRKRLHLAIAEARLRLGDTKAAKHNLEVARALGHNRSDRAEVDYLLARKLLAEGDVEGAETLWREVATSDHASSRARARFVMVERDLAADRIDRKEAIARLERLRFAWRGDTFEAVLLHRLADLYAGGGEYRRALTALRQAASHLPDTAWAQGAADRMRDIFKQVFLEGGADRMPPLKALALYESFRELTPAEPEGDRMISNLVDRLVEVDLLERAADLLDGQVRHRLAGVRRTKAGARLASIYLLDAKPGKALDALDISKGTGGAKALVDRRRHLRARALAKLDRGDEALALLQGDNSADGLRLKADIHADASRWGKAADALDGLLPDAPKPGAAMAEGNVRQVLRSAVALTLAGRGDELDRLQKRYGEAMRQSKHAETFRLLAGSENGQGVSTIAQRLAEVSQAKAFMNTFLDSLQQQASLGGGQS